MLERLVDVKLSRTPDAVTDDRWQSFPRCSTLALLITTACSIHPVFYTDVFLAAPISDSNLAAMYISSVIQYSHSMATATAT